LKEGDIVLIGAISGVLGPDSGLDTYHHIKTGTAASVPLAPIQASVSTKASVTSSGNTVDTTRGPPGTGLSDIEAAVQTFLSDYQTVYGSGQPVQPPPGSGASGLDVAQLTAALHTVSRDFSAFFGRALGADVQPFGLPLSSTQALAAEQAARVAIRSSGSARQTAAPVVTPDNEAGQAPLAPTGIQPAAISDNAAASAGRSNPGGPASPAAKG
jgi:hypothetical protein